MDLSNNAVEIIPRLFLGPYEAAKNLEFIEQNNISVIVNCTRNLENCFSLNFKKSLEEAPLEVQQWIKDNCTSYIKYYRIPIDDKDTIEENELFYNETSKVLPELIELYLSGKTILVHCLAGIQRSASLVVIMLVYLLEISLEDALVFLEMRKPNVFFFGSNVHFKVGLNTLFEKAFLKKRLSQK